jgi:hypothetical protein
MKIERVSLQNKYGVIQSFIASNKTKENWKQKNKDAPRKTHSIWNNKNIVFRKMTWYFLLMKKRVPWASPSFDACNSWIFLGVTWASPSLSFCPSFVSSHHSPFPTLENFLHTKLHTILISNISLCKIVDPLFTTRETLICGAPIWASVAHLWCTTHIKPLVFITRGARPRVPRLSVLSVEHLGGVRHA